MFHETLHQLLTENSIDFNENENGYTNKQQFYKIKNKRKVLYPSLDL